MVRSKSKSNNDVKLDTTTLINKYHSNLLRKQAIRLEKRRLSTQRCRAKQRKNTSRYKTIHISAIQANEIQILPTFNEKYPRYNKMTDYEKFMYCKAQQQRCANGNNRSQKIRGCAFLGEHVEKDNNILHVRSNANINVSNTIANGKREKSTIVVRYLDKDMPSMSTFTQCASNIAVRWESEGNNTCTRKVLGGKMKHFGVVKGAGNFAHFAYELIQSDLKTTNKKWKGVNEYHRDLNVAAQDIAIAHFPGAHKSIQSAMAKSNKTVPDFLGGVEGSVQRWCSHSTTL